MLKQKCCLEKNVTSAKNVSLMGKNNLGGKKTHGEKNNSSELFNLSFPPLVIETNSRPFQALSSISLIRERERAGGSLARSIPLNRSWSSCERSNVILGRDLKQSNSVVPDPVVQVLKITPLNACGKEMSLSTHLEGMSQPWAWTILRAEVYLILTVSDSFSTA